MLPAGFSKHENGNSMCVARGPGAHNCCCRTFSPHRCMFDASALVLWDACKKQAGVIHILKGRYAGLIGSFLCVASEVSTPDAMQVFGSANSATYDGITRLMRLFIIHCHTRRSWSHAGGIQQPLKHWSCCPEQALASTAARKQWRHESDRNAPCRLF